MKTVNFSNILGNDVENVNDIELNTKKGKKGKMIKLRIVSKENRRWKINISLKPLSCSVIKDICRFFFSDLNRKEEGVIFLSRIQWLVKY